MQAVLIPKDGASSTTSILAFSSVPEGLIQFLKNSIFQSFHFSCFKGKKRSDAEIGAASETYMPINVL